MRMFKAILALLVLGLVARYAHGDTKISALPNGSALAGTELLPIVQGGSTVATTPAAIRTYVIATGGTTLLGTVTANGSSTTMTVSSIPGTYNHLRVIVMGREAGAATIDIASLRFNGDSGANYDQENLNAISTTTTFAQTVGSTGAFFMGVLGATASPSTRASIGDALIPAYAGTTFDKQGTSTWSANSGTGAGTQGTGILGFSWRPATPAAITSVSAITGSGNWVSGSTMYVYGVN